MAVSRAERWEERKSKVVAAFGSDEGTLRTVSRLFELMELAWHDCYGEITPPDKIVDDILICSAGSLEGLIDAIQLAVVDRRDLELWASDVRRR
jgi:hypothetical protein